MMKFEFYINVKIVLSAPDPGDEFDEQQIVEGATELQNLIVQSVDASVCSVETNLIEISDIDLTHSKIKV